MNWIYTKIIQFKQRKVILPLPTIPDHHHCPTTAIEHMYDWSPAQQDLFIYDTIPERPIARL